MSAHDLQFDLRSSIRTIRDYPKPGIMFRDITTLLGDARAFRRAVDELVQPWAGSKIDKVAGMEARGFILGAAMALEDAICLANVVADCDGDFPRAFQRYQDIRTVRTARVQISSLMMDRINHAKGLERKVRNSLFEGRTAEEYYDRLAWLYTPPAYVK